nr:ankyrin repeat domain-containing protein [Tatlockia sp.]
EDKLRFSDKPFHELKREDLPFNDDQALILLMIIYPKVPVTQYREQLSLDAKNRVTFITAVESGAIETLNWIKEQATKEELLAMLKSYSYYYFGWVVRDGHFDILKWLKEQAPEESLAILRSGNYQVFSSAAGMGRLDILNWLKEQAPDELLAMIKADYYGAFSSAASNGHLGILKWLKEQAPEEWLAINKGGEGHLEYGAFHYAAKRGHIDILIWFKEQVPEELLAMIKAYNKFALSFGFLRKASLDSLNWLKEQAPEESLVMIRQNDYFSLTWAAGNGRVDIMNWLKQQVSEEELLVMIRRKDYERENYRPFSDAAKYGHLNSLIWLKEQAPDELLDMIKVNGYAAFGQAAESGHLNILKWLKKQAPEECLAMIQTYKYYPFRYAAINGHLDSLKWFKKQAPDELLAMIKAEDYEAFRAAAAKGHRDTVNWLLSHADCLGYAMQHVRNYSEHVNPFIFKTLRMLHQQSEAFLNQNPNGVFDIPDNFLAMIQFNDYYAFGCAAANGHLDMLKWFKEKAPYDFLAMIKANDYLAFRWAAANGQLDILLWLQEQAPDYFVAMIQAEDYLAFRDAAKNGQLAILLWLKEQAPDDFPNMIRADNYEAFLFAAAKGLRDTVNWLLTHPDCLAHAEQHVHEYSALVNPFIDRTLMTLHQQGEAFLNQNPNGVFDINEGEQARLCFYMIRNLIRRNDRAHDDELRFLFTIPSVKALLHQEITEGRRNELLRLAMTSGNQVAATLLLNIEAVRRLAERNNFYREERNRGVDLRQLAQDRESSMIALTEGEATRLEKAIAHYQPLIQAAGIQMIMQGLMDGLSERYLNQPAFITINGESINLPQHYAEFNALNLTERQREEALIAYYQNPAHTAWRYLSKPNPWMHQNASYVNINEDRTERWSTFEEYQSLIALMYLAAIDSDKGMEPIEGHSLEGRIKHFINELALIGRAHNWDTSRIRNNRLEEVDDLRADKPSCFSGVKRRLFQSVIGHPLFDVLAAERIENEIRQFAFAHFQSLLTKENQDGFKLIFDECILNLEEQNVAKLQYFDISSEKQQEFMAYLTQKYGSQYSGNARLQAQVNDAFLLTPNSKNSRFRYHVLKLLDLTGFYNAEGLSSAVEQNPPEELSLPIQDQVIPQPELQPESRIQALKKKINQAILGKSIIKNARTDLPEENSYLGWMNINATGTRGLTRFSHWYHGDSGVQRARELLEIANDPDATYGEIQSALQKGFQESSYHKHSLSRYLVAQFNQINQNFIELEELGDDEFVGIKAKFNFN